MAGFALLALSLSLLLPSGAGAEAEAPTASSILEKAAAHQGGGSLAAKDAIRDFHVQLDVREYDPGDGSRAEGTLWRWYKPAAGARTRPLFRERWKNSGGITERGLGRRDDRIKGWTKKGRMLTVLEPKDRDTYEKLKGDTRDMGVLLRSFLLRNLMGAEAKITLLGEVRVGERVEWRIRREVKDERTLILGIDKASLELGRVIVAPTETQPLERTFVFALHRVVQGIRIPDRIEIWDRTAAQVASGGAGRRTTLAFVEELKLNQGLEDAFFDVPEA